MGLLAIQWVPPTERRGAPQSTSIRWQLLYYVALSHLLIHADPEL
jgi:hypothetical protein